MMREIDTNSFRFLPRYAVFREKAADASGRGGFFAFSALTLAPPQDSALVASASPRSPDRQTGTLNDIRSARALS